MEGKADYKVMVTEEAGGKYTPGMVVEIPPLGVCEVITKNKGPDFWQHHNELVLKKLGESDLESECVKPIGLGLDVIMVSKYRRGK